MINTNTPTANTQSGDCAQAHHPMPNGQGGAQPKPEIDKKAFLFYTNWYDDTLQSLTEEQQGKFLLIIVRYASYGILPDDSTPAILRTMFGLIRNVIDADLVKYEKAANKLRERAAKLHERTAKRRKTVAATEQTLSVDTQRNNPENPLHLTPDTLHLTPNTLSEEKKEEEALARFADVEVYWQQRGFKSSAREFYDFYDLRQWVGRRGERMQSWKKAACMWEDKFRRDVLPVRRREAQAEAREQREQRQAENRRIREEQREARKAEADDRAVHTVTREQSRYMYSRAMALAGGDDTRAMELLERSAHDAATFHHLLEGYRQAG